jgi:Ca2+-binding RTX toxin-like protein
MAYNPFITEPVLAGTTGTGLDQIVETIAQDRGLAGRITGKDIEGGAAAANGLNALLVQAAMATGAAADGVFTVEEVLAMNAWVRADSQRYNTFVDLHGDDERRTETGFHLVQNDGAATQYRGQNFVNTVADGIYHFGFEVKDGNFLNEDGNANASVAQVAEWLTQLWTDHSTTGTGLDRMTDLIMADRGLDKRISDGEIAGGAEAANGINSMIADAIKALGLDADHAISTADVEAINAWIRSDAARCAEFIALHGDDEKGSETGFHLVQGDGASTARFGKNFVNTVADGIYHIGFDIQNGRFLNEDGRANAKVSDVASWIDYFYSDVSTTGTGLDWITDSIKSDTGLASKTAAADINGGARAADGLNNLIVDGIRTLGVDQDGELSVEDILAVNAWIRQDTDRFARFVELHGDDENGIETGFHLVQGDGGTLKYHCEQLINTVADGIYHIGFAVEGERFLNEDGDANAEVADVATWLNSFYLGRSIILDSDSGNKVKGTNDADVLYGRGGDDSLFGNDGDDRLDCGDGCDVADGGFGNDELIGAAGGDTLRGAQGDDRLDGGEGCDTMNGGAGNDVLLGGADADKLAGSDGNDSLADGLGCDTLAGGGGNDLFVFDTAPAVGNVDRVSDFQVGADKFVLSTQMFTALGGGDILASAEFVYGRQALDADDHIIYDKLRGSIYYDADGVGGVDQVLIATTNKVALTAADFLLS